MYGFELKFFCEILENSRKIKIIFRGSDVLIFKDTFFLTKIS